MKYENNVIYSFTNISSFPALIFFIMVTLKGQLRIKVCKLQLWDDTVHTVEQATHVTYYCLNFK